MTQQVASIESWHAHVYFDAASRERAFALRTEVTETFAGKMEIGRFHEKSVGPHPCWSFQIAFASAAFASIVPWLSLNRRDLVVFTHPNTGDAVGDHRDRAIWMGAKLELDLAALT